MLSKLKETLKSFAKRVTDVIKYRDLSDSEIIEFSDKLLLELIEADVAFDVAQIIVEEIKQKFNKIKVQRGRDPEAIVIGMAREVVAGLLQRGKSSDLIDVIKGMVRESKPVKIVFVGVNGVGKTTTIAKMAFKLMKNSLKPVIVAADTFRAGAQEQLKKHSINLGIPFIGGRYGADPASIAYDGIAYARRNNYDVVLIDTAGRMHIDADLMNELRKVVRVVNPDFKILIVDALTGNDAVEQVKLFDEAIGIDGVILTKLDADAKGGATLSVIVSIAKPIYFIGVGQHYEDLEVYDPEAILERLFR